MYIYIYIYVYVQYACVCMYVCMCVCVCMHVCMYVQYMYTYIYNILETLDYTTRHEYLAVHKPFYISISTLPAQHTTFIYIHVNYLRRFNLSHNISQLTVICNGHKLFCN